MQRNNDLELCWVIRTKGIRILAAKNTHRKSSLSSCRGFFVCHWFSAATSQHKQFILTHKDTFSRSHLTKQPTGNRTDTSLSALCSPFSEIAAPRYQTWVTLPVFLLYVFAQGFLGKDWRYRKARPPLHAAGSQRSHFLFGGEWMQKCRWFRQEKGRSHFSICTYLLSSSSLLSFLSPFCCLVPSHWELAKH